MTGGGHSYKVVAFGLQSCEVESFNRMPTSPLGHGSLPENDIHFRFDNKGSI